MRPEGVIGFPFRLDPMVMYWNRRLFNQRSIPQVPATWSELKTRRFRSLTQAQNDRIVQSMIAMGQYDNITNVRGILSTLFLQTGNAVVAQGRGGPVSVLNNQPTGASIRPGLAAINFYTQFANPRSPLYNWNNAMPSSRDAFLAGDVAMYLGYASEFEGLTQANPNLDIGIAEVPQRAGYDSDPHDTKTTHARLNAFAVTKQSRNKQAALQAIDRLRPHPRLRISPISLICRRYVVT